MNFLFNSTPFAQTFLSFFTAMVGAFSVKRFFPLFICVPANPNVMWWRRWRLSPFPQLLKQLFLFFSPETDSDPICCVTGATSNERIKFRPFIKWPTSEKFAAFFVEMLSAKNSFCFARFRPGDYSQVTLLDGLRNPIPIGLKYCTFSLFSYHAPFAWSLEAFS